MEEHLWWQRGVIYQIYPLSFADSNGDGYGDLPGITGKLDYLEELGVNAVWVSPIYPSPMADWSYDVSDYTGVHLPYNFQLVPAPWDASHVFAGINKYEASLPPFGWPNWVLGNHDKPRVAGRIGPAQARVAAMLTLRGTPTMYYGDEIGMHDVTIPPEQARDPVEKAFPGRGYGRDPARTPMHWNGKRNAGFSAGRPWLPVADDYEQGNVERQKQDDGSLLAFYRRLLKFRGDEPVMQIGRYRPAGEHANMLAFFREDEQTRFLVAVNLSDSGGTLAVPRHMNVAGRVVLGTESKRVGEKIDHRIRLEPNEGIIAKLGSPGR
jgi:alpha-glucosidase